MPCYCIGSWCHRMLSIRPYVQCDIQSVTQSIKTHLYSAICRKRISCTLPLQPSVSVFSLHNFSDLVKSLKFWAEQRWGRESRRFSTNESPYLGINERLGQGRLWSLIGSCISPFNRHESHRPWMTLNGHYALCFAKSCVLWSSPQKFERR